MSWEPCRWTRCLCPGPAQRLRRPRSPPATAPLRRCSSRQARPRAPAGTLRPTRTRRCRSRGLRRAQAVGAPLRAPVRQVVHTAWHAGEGKYVCAVTWEQPIRAKPGLHGGLLVPIALAVPGEDCLRTAC